MMCVSIPASRPCAFRRWLTTTRPSDSGSAVSARNPTCSSRKQLPLPPHTLLLLGISAVLLVSSSSSAAAAAAAASPPLRPPPSQDAVRRRLNDHYRHHPLLRVFVLVGQSNMVGHGICSGTNATTGVQLNGTLEWLTTNVPSQYGMLQSTTDDGEKEWTERPDVWVAYNRQDIGDVEPAVHSTGKLKAGFGGDRGQEGQMGPELGFGWAVGDGLNHKNDNTDTIRQKRRTTTGGSGKDKMLLLKVAWGGRSLAVDFRPPSSGGQVGPYYDAVIDNVKTTLANLESIFPSFDRNARTVISGLAWHQGWNDGCDEEMTAEYEYNLANLIRDVRTDLGVTDLPISIGVSGMAGYSPGLRADIVHAQLAVGNATKYPEFFGTVASVDTRQFLREPRPHSPSDLGYHWNNNAESYWLVGRAMGKAMVELVLRREEMDKKEAREGLITLKRVGKAGTALIA